MREHKFGLLFFPTPVGIPDFSIEKFASNVVRGRKDKLLLSLSCFAGYPKFYVCIKHASKNPGLPCKADKIR
ncbi:MAG TPA: hypothetical protein DE315_05535 [Candidatus Omnitrophica bacterium]|nr:hypothetical protein [Candidatus Omnitrophota bacterium]HCI44972.1 hypothetical protein [Candidatus Omnitrophota bacterium]